MSSAKVANDSATCYIKARLNGTDYIMLTDDLGKTPLDAKKFIVVAAYDDADCFLWGVELKNFAALKELCAQYAPGSAELFQAMKDYKLPKKK